MIAVQVGGKDGIGRRQAGLYVCGDKEGAVPPGPQYRDVVPVHVSGRRQVNLAGRHMHGHAGRIGVHGIGDRAGERNRRCGRVEKHGERITSSGAAVGYQDVDLEVAVDIAESNRGWVGPGTEAVYRAEIAIAQILKDQYLAAVSRRCQHDVLESRIKGNRPGRDRRCR